MLGYILWDCNGVMFEFGGIKIMWYGVLFATGLALSAWWIFKRFIEEGMTEKDFEVFVIWGFVCMFLGCRLAHCLFYQWDYFSQHPLEILLPIKEKVGGGWKFIGYHGLASHGGTVGMVVALVIFKLKTKKSLWKTMDIVAVSACLAGGFIRLGNLMNSEILGIETTMPWGFVFTRVGDVPRHPAQLYEAIYYFVLFIVLQYVYKKKRYSEVSDGFYVGLVLTGIFLFRFLIEFLKEVQEDFESDMLLDMGQILSVPFIVAGVIIIFLRKSGQKSK